MGIARLGSLRELALAQSHGLGIIGKDTDARVQDSSDQMMLMEVREQMWNEVNGRMRLGRSRWSRDTSRR